MDYRQKQGIQQYFIENDINMQSEELRKRLLFFAENSPQWVGQALDIHQFISTNADNFDPHFTTSAKFAYMLIHFGIRMSGAKMMFMGEVFSYEIDLGSITEFNKSEQTYFFIEKLSGTVYRKSVLSFKTAHRS